MVERFRAAGFFSLADKYEATVTDSPTYEVSIKIGDAVKTVTDYIGQSVGMPATVTAIEVAIDRAAKVERWISGTDETMPMLRAANWDFRSRQAADVLACSATGAPGWLVSEMLAAGVPTNGTCDDHSAVENAAYAARAGAFKVLVEAGGAEGASQRSRNNFLISGIMWCEPDLVAAALTLKPDLEVSSEPDFIPPLGLALGACEARESDGRDKTIRILRLLIAAGIDLNRRFADGGTIAFNRSDAASVKALVAVGADINLRNTFGRTPLLSAKSEDAAIALIEAGADTTARSNSGQSVLDYARENQWSKVVQILERQP
ncbi:ankyrin repeat domain-containing protein [Oleomonas cavernae]|uniref:Ankyrin repeat domain-containing protein n=1 Tax=Oleomonas cavernae TaxID=2320859 RepID=A0A418WHZ5_9PROT|nr:ankyrin repeat domain-containing protein [Oleomonas cavernae]RJF89643.1 ankyrin repeat domain-containing protein [Oleomonas cavernae]